MKELGVEIKDIKSVFSVKNADEPALVHFLGVAPSEWKVTSDYRSETWVTLAPVAGQGHTLVDNSVIVFALTQKSTVLSGKRGSDLVVLCFLFHTRSRPQGADQRRILPKSVVRERNVFDVEARNMK